MSWPVGSWGHTKSGALASAPRSATKTSASGEGADVTPSTPYQVAITQRDAPHHSVVADLHDKPPTPSEGGGGWEEVALPKRGAVLIWRGRGLMKLSLSVIFDEFAVGQSVIDATYTTLLRFWRPEGADTKTNYSAVEPSILKLSSRGDVVPYRNLAWVISALEWGAAQGDERGSRTQQVLDLSFTEHRADERLRAAPGKRTKPYLWRRGDTLAKVAARYHTTAKALGALQKPPISDGRKLTPGKSKIVVPV